MKKTGKNAWFSTALAALPGLSPQTAGLTREVYDRAQENRAAFIGERFSQSRIGTGLQNAAPLLEEEKQAVFAVVNGPADDFAEATGRHRVFTIGDAPGRRYAGMARGEPGWAIGCIPIE